MYQGDVVVGDDDVAESGQALFYPLDLDAVWEGVAEVLQLLVGCAGGDQETFAVSATGSVSQLFRNRRALEIRRWGERRTLLLTGPRCGCRQLWFEQSV